MYSYVLLMPRSTAVTDVVEGLHVPLLWSVLCGVCVLTAAVLTDAIQIPGARAGPPSALLGAFIFVLAVPLLVRRWRATFWLLLVWLVVEGLVRKYTW